MKLAKLSVGVLFVAAGLVPANAFATVVGPYYTHASACVGATAADAAKVHYTINGVSNGSASAANVVCSLDMAPAPYSFWGATVAVWNRNNGVALTCRLSILDYL